MDDLASHGCILQSSNEAQVLWSVASHKNQPLIDDEK